MQFLFADHTLDTDTRELRRGDRPIAVEPQVFDVLTYLLQNRERVVSKGDLFASVWRGRTVADSTLASPSTPPARPSVTAPRSKN